MRFIESIYSPVKTAIPLITKFLRSRNSGLKLALIYMCLLTPIVGYLSGPSLAFAVILCGTIVAILTRFDDFTWFKLYGLEAALQEKIKEATLTLEQVQKLAHDVGAATIYTISVSGQLATTTVSYRDAHIASVIASLVHVGVGDDEIKKILEPWHHAQLATLATAIPDAANNHVVRARIDKQLRDLFMRTSHPHPDDINKILNDEGIGGSTPAREALANYKYCFDNPRPRRETFPYPDSLPDIWGGTRQRAEHG